jgi:hypothetical protein
MAFESTRKTKAAIVEETFGAGIPVPPSSGSDYIAIQDGFEITPQFELIQNQEVQGTIGRSAPTPGLESVTARFSHYLRHSGTEGTFPNYSLLMKSMFGSSNANTTERATTGGSTAGSSSARAIIKLAAGGADLIRGRALMLKDAVNGYRIRNVHSVDTNDITLAQNIPAAPASGVNTGICLSMHMEDAGIPFSYWDYRGDGGALQIASGLKADSATINIEAGQPINVDYTFQGSKYYFNPITITAANRHIDFDEGAGELTAALDMKTYRDPEELAIQIAAKMTAAAVATISCSYSSATGKYTISTGGATLTIRWLSGTNTLTSAGPAIGFDITANDTGATSYVGDSAVSWASPFTPVLDSTGFLIAKNNELMMGGFHDFACVGARTVTVNFGKETTDATSVCAESGLADKLFNGRDVTIDVVAYLERNDIRRWLQFKENQTVVFTYNAGTKSGGFWVPGSCVNIHCPTAKVSSFSIQDEGGIATLQTTLTCFVDSSQDEFYLNYL